MRSISIKITLVLIIVSLIGAGFTAFFVQNRTQTAFDKFINDQDKTALVEILTDHYIQNGNWEDVNQIFRNFFSQFHPNPGEGNPGNQPNIPNPFFLTSAEGVIVSGVPGASGPKTGNQLPPSEFKKGTPIEVDDEVVGWLLPVQMQRPRSTNQQDFLGTVQQGLIISTLVTLLIALALGGVLILNFTRPIRKLADGTERIANGELGFQVEIKSGDELGRLAASFNEMSADLLNADRIRKQMTADIAHDLRTPLSILYGYTEAISEGKMAPSPDITQAMHQQTRHLSYLIEDLRTLSLLDSEELQFQLEVIDPARILSETFTAFATLAAKNDISLSQDIADTLPRVRLDPDRLTQILGNLLNNAINVLPAGGSIWLKAWQEGDHLLIEVKDDGPGIPEESLPHIFTRHYKIDPSRGSDERSSGLGLAIAKKLVEAQGGSIAVESEIDMGCTFRIIFPVS